MGLQLCFSIEGLCRSNGYNMDNWHTQMCACYNINYEQDDNKLVQKFETLTQDTFVLLEYRHCRSGPLLWFWHRSCDLKGDMTKLGAAREKALVSNNKYTRVCVCPRHVQWVCDISVWVTIVVVMSNINVKMMPCLAYMYMCVRVIYLCILPSYIICFKYLSAKTLHNPCRLIACCG